MKMSLGEPVKCLEVPLGTLEVIVVLTQCMFHNLQGERLVPEGIWNFQLNKLEKLISNHT